MRIVSDSEMNIFQHVRSLKVHFFLNTKINPPYRGHDVLLIYFLFILLLLRKLKHIITFTYCKLSEKYSETSWNNFESSIKRSVLRRQECNWRAELGIRYFLPFLLLANTLLQCSYSLSLLRYFSEICNTLFAICYFLWTV
jgi:lipopolysaccharide export LptBFGC system permease protein LptF